jgi:hypothetical protein
MCCRLVAFDLWLDVSLGCVAAGPSSFHNSDSKTETSCQTAPPFKPKVTQVARFDTQNDAKILKKCVPRTTFCANDQHAIRSRWRSPNAVLDVSFCAGVGQNVAQEAL